MRDIRTLEEKLRRINGRGYKAYKDIEGRYTFPGGTLEVLHAQGDPFASPSKLRLFIPMDRAGFPRELFDSFPKRVALQDYILRVFSRAISRHSRPRGTGKSGLYFVDAGHQKVLLRSDCTVTPEMVEIRFTAGLPARGRSVLGSVAADMLCREVPQAASTVRWSLFDQKKTEMFVKLVEDVELIRERLREMGLVAFVADGSILPRRSGVDDRPLEKAVVFRSPDTLRVSFETRHFGVVSGMGIPEGVTLIVGGGFHGKSTLLSAIEQGIYPHIPGDGREWVVTVEDAVKVRSEDGRYVEKVDISSFIGELPNGSDTSSFSTENASGSTSVAAAISEALEMGARVLLMDEDTTATNFLIRDARMQRLVEKEKEPITPFIDRVRELYSSFGVSTVMVVGGAGDYLDVADTVIAMDAYVPRDVTKKAMTIAREMPTGRVKEPVEPMKRPPDRRILPDTFRVRKSHKVKSKGLKEIMFGSEVIDVSFVEQLVDNSQLRAVAEILRFLSEKPSLSRMRDELFSVDRAIRASGFDAIGSRPMFGLAWVRPHEVASALNRMRSLKVKQEVKG